NSEQVAGERPALRIESALFANQREKNLLGDILGYRSRTTHMQREPIDGRLAPAVERHKSLLVAAAQAHQQSIVRFRKIRRHWLLNYDSLCAREKFHNSRAGIRRP